MGRCLSPCDGTASHEDYTITVEALRTALDSSPADVTAAVRRRMELLAAAERFEEAASHRNRMTSFIRAAARSQRLRALTGCAEIVAGRRNDLGQWEVHVFRHGRLAAAGVIPAGASAREWTTQFRAGAETVVPGHGPAPAATPEESEKLLRWLERDGVRLIHVDGTWSCPVDGAESQRDLLDEIEASRDSLAPFDTPRLSGTLARPHR
jgi:DNA polymerase-3 subunit epsilon